MTTAEPTPDWRPLEEDVSDHTMAIYLGHEDHRTCGYHSRLGKWTFEGTKECLREHIDPTRAWMYGPGPDAEWRDES